MQEVSRKDEITYEEFAALFHKLVHVPEVNHFIVLVPVKGVKVLFSDNNSDVFELN